MYYPRDVEDRLKEAAKYFEAIVVYGARQVGKSTTAKAVFSSGFSYVALDDSDELSLALSNPKGFSGEPSLAGAYRRGPKSAESIEPHQVENRRGERTQTHKRRAQANYVRPDGIKPF